MTSASGRLQREWGLLRATNPDELGFWAAPVKPTDLSIWEGQIKGPKGSPYEGGVFNLEITFDSKYPFNAPTVIFKTRIYHCNISASGKICLDLLDKHWRASIKLKDLLVAIHTLLAEPNPEDPLIASIAIQLDCKKEEHDEVARKWVEKFTEKWSPPKKVAC